MANFKTKSIKEIREDLLNRYEVFRREQGIKAEFKQTGIISAIFWAIAGVAATLWKYGLWVYKQCFPQTCDLPALKMWGYLVSVFYREGNRACVKIKIKDASASYLSAQSVFLEKEKGLIFKTVSTAANIDGEICAVSECSTIGAIGNLEIGDKLTLANPTAGIPQEAEVISLVKLGCEDEEKELYRQRVLNGFKKKAQPGSAYDYRDWGLEVPGVEDILAYVFEDGTITIYPVGQGSGDERKISGELTPNPFPKWVNGQFSEFEGSGQMLALAYAIEGSSIGAHDRRPLNAKVELKQSAIFTPFSVEIDGLEDVSFSERIKETLIGILDKKRPHIVALNYPLNNAKVNKGQLSAACYNLLNGESFSSFLLKNADDEIIEQEILGVGCLAYLKKLTINGEVYYEKSV